MSSRRATQTAATRRRAELRSAEERLARIIRHGAQGAALARVLAREGVRTRADLRKASVFSRLPRESQANVLYPPTLSIVLETAQEIVSELRRRLVFAVADCEVVAAGSVRRQAPRVKDMDILVVVPPGAESRIAGVLASASLRPARGARLEIVDTYLSGARRRSLVLRAPGERRARYYHVDLFAFTPAERPFALFHYTGSKTYNIRIRAFAKRKGWRLNQYGVFSTATGHRVRGSSAIRTEQDLATFLGVTYRLPTDRVR